MTNPFGTPAALACVRGGDDAPQLRGVVSFYRRPRGVLVVADVSGLPSCNESGFFALHIHRGGSCAGEGFPETEGHYDPRGQEHPRHAGDLPPLLSNGGRAYMAVLTNRFCIDEIIGRTVIIHGGPDDFKTQPGGGAGEKIACGVIRRRR